jgi:hypothetical protein
MTRTRNMANVPAGRGGSLLGSLWRLFFAVGYQRPRSWVERRQLRFRASFFFVLGVLLTLGVQYELGRWWFSCLRP